MPIRPPAFKVVLRGLWRRANLILLLRFPARFQQHIVNTVTLPLAGLVLPGPDRLPLFARRFASLAAAQRILLYLASKPPILGVIATPIRAVNYA